MAKKKEAEYPAVSLAGAAEILSKGLPDLMFLFIQCQTVVDFLKKGDLNETQQKKIADIMAEAMAKARRVLLPRD